MKKKKLLLLLIIFLVFTLLKDAVCLDMSYYQRLELEYVPHLYWSTDNKIYLSSFDLYDEIATMPVKAVMSIFAYAVLMFLPVRGPVRRLPVRWLGDEIGTYYYEINPPFAKQKRINKEDLPFEYRKISSQGFFAFSGWGDKINELHIIDVEERKVHKIIDTRPYFLKLYDWSPDGSEIVCVGINASFITSESPADFKNVEEDLFIVNINDSKIKKIFEGKITNAAWRHSSKIAFTTEEKGKAYVLDRNDPDQVFELNINARDIALSSKYPDRLYYVDYGDQRLKSIDITRPGIEPRILFDGSVKNIDMSPSGEYIFFRFFAISNKDIYLIGADGSGPKKIGQFGQGKYKLFGRKL